MKSHSKLIEMTLRRMFPIAALLMAELMGSCEKAQETLTPDNNASLEKSKAVNKPTKSDK
jgi:uncharacterized lipoprotein YajG